MTRLSAEQQAKLNKSTTSVIADILNIEDNSAFVVEDGLTYVIQQLLLSCYGDHEQIRHIGMINALGVLSAAEEQYKQEVVAPYYSQLKYDTVDVVQSDNDDEPHQHSTDESDSLFSAPKIVRIEQNER